MNYVLLGSYGKPSIRAIRAEMREPCQLVFTHRHIPAFNENDLLIRFGCQTEIQTNHAKVINKSRALANASDKGLARHIMQENEVSIPKTWFAPVDVNEFPIVARYYHHRKGQNFYIANNLAKVYEVTREMRSRSTEFVYYSKVINKTNEYRVHVGHGKVLLIHEKPLIEGELRANQAITGQSWGNVIPWDDYRRPLCKLACDAVKCLGLDMGAVDIMKGRDGQFYVCEVNTAPTLHDSPYSVTRYAKYFDWVLRHSGGDWFDYTQWEAGKSFSWKNSQLEA